VQGRGARSRGAGGIPEDVASIYRGQIKGCPKGHEVPSVLGKVASAEALDLRVYVGI